MMKDIPKNAPNCIPEGATLCCSYTENSHLELGSSKTIKQDGYGFINIQITNNSNSEYELMKVKTSKHFTAIFRFRNRE